MPVNTSRRNRGVSRLLSFEARAFSRPSLYDMSAYFSSAWHASSDLAAHSISLKLPDSAVNDVSTSIPNIKAL